MKKIVISKVVYFLTKGIVIITQMAAMINIAISVAILNIFIIDVLVIKWNRKLGCVKNVCFYLIS